MSHYGAFFKDTSKNLDNNLVILSVIGQLFMIISYTKIFEKYSDSLEEITWIIGNVSLVVILGLIVPYEMLNQVTLPMIAVVFGIFRFIRDHEDPWMTIAMYYYLPDLMILVSFILMISADKPKKESYDHVLP